MKKNLLIISIVTIGSLIQASTMEDLESKRKNAEFQQSNNAQIEYLHFDPADQLLADIAARNEAFDRARIQLGYSENDVNGPILFYPSATNNQTPRRRAMNPLLLASIERSKRIRREISIKARIDPDTNRWMY